MTVPVNAESERNCDEAVGRPYSRDDNVSDSKKRPLSESGKRAKAGPDDASSAPPSLEALVREKTEELEKAYNALVEEMRERTRAEDIAKTERKRLSDVMNMIPAYVILLSPDYHVPFANRFFEERFGKSNGKRCFEYLFDRGEPCETCETFTVLKTNKPHRWEWTGPDGRHYDIYDYPFTDADGSPLILEMGVDITERKRAEEMLRQAHDILEARVRDRTEELAQEQTNLQRIFDSVSIGLLLVDPNGVVRRVNDVIGQWVGQPPSEISGVQPGDLVGCIHALGNPQGCGQSSDCNSCLIRATFESVFQSGRSIHNVETETIVSKDGQESKLWISVGADPVMVDGRRHVILSLNNIADRKRAEEALRQSEERYRSLFNAMTDGFALHEIICDAEGAPRDYRFLEVNPAFERLTGLKREDIVGKTHNEVLPGDNPAWVETYGRVALTGQSDLFEDYSPALNKHFEVFAYRPAPGQFAVVFRDVSERKQAEQALRQSREDLNRAQAVSHTGSWRLDVRKDQLLWSDETYRIFGIPTGTPLTYEVFLESVHPDDRDLVDRSWQSAMKGEPYDIEHRILVEGKVRWVRERAELEFGEDGSLRGGFGTAHDVTERKEMEQRLRQHQDWLQVTLASIADAVIATDREGRIAFVNRAALKLAGMERSEALGRLSSEIFPLVNTRTGEIARDIISVTLERKEIVELTGHTALVSRHGRQIPIENRAAPILDNMGEVVGVVVVFRDVTQQRRAVDALRKAHERLEERVQSRTASLKEANAALIQRGGQLRALASELTLAEHRERRRLAGMLHDHLQQLLVGTQFLVSSLVESPDNLTRETAEKMNDLLNQAVESSRTLTGELCPPILYDAGLAQALKWLCRWMLEKHGLSVELECEGDADASDPEDLRVLLFQAVRELLFNTVKHAKVKTAKLLMQRTEDILEVVIEDSGAGFDPAEALSPQSASGGFGLFSIQERLGLLDGALHIRSAPGKGSCFTLRVPLLGIPEDAAALPPVTTSSNRAVKRAPARKRRARKVRILLADDHTIVRQGLSQFLQREPDMKVVGEAANGLEAVDMALRLRPDVIVMDVNMPEMSGIKATSLIHAALPEIAVIGLSMLQETEIAQEMLKAGARSYIVKSEAPARMIAAIREAAGKPPPRT